MKIDTKGKTIGGQNKSNFSCYITPSLDQRSKGQSQARKRTKTSRTAGSQTGSTDRSRGGSESLKHYSNSSNQAIIHTHQTHIISRSLFM